MEKYIEAEKIEGKLKDALLEWDKGNSNAGDIAWFHGISLDTLIYHIKNKNNEWD